MVMLVLAGNFLILYVFWEAVGLCSYLLIGFWYEKKSASDAGKKAFIVNRVGDFGFGLGIMLIWVTFGTLNYGEVFAKADASVLHQRLPRDRAAPLHGRDAASRAQLPLFTWLPDAMEGPTPVSALIHAATMVTAGVYMVARCHVLFEMAPLSLEIVAWVGAAHRALRGHHRRSSRPTSSACSRTPRSASSATCSWASGSARTRPGIFHLVTHAFFKALLFLGAGSVIHGLCGEQDLRKMGGLAPRMMTTTVTFLVGRLRPGRGAAARRLLLEGRDPRRGRSHGSRYLLWALLLVGAFMTAFYMFRLVFLAFFGGPRMPKEVAHHIHESPAVMTLPLIVLAILDGGGRPRGRHSLVAGHRVRALPRPGARRCDEAEHSAGSRSACWCSRPSSAHRGGRARLDGLRPQPGARRVHRGGAQPAPQAADREVLRRRDLRRALRAADLPASRSGWPASSTPASSTASSTASRRWSSAGRAASAGCRPAS